MAFSGNGNTDFEKGEKFVVMVVSVIRQKLGMEEKGDIVEFLS